MSLEDKLAELYEYDSGLEGGKRHKEEWIKYASNLLRESFPAPSEPAKDVMELARKIWDFNNETGEWPEYEYKVSALIQSSFEAWVEGKVNAEYSHGFDDGRRYGHLEKSSEHSPVQVMIDGAKKFQQGMKDAVVPKLAEEERMNRYPSRPAPTDEKGLREALSRASYLLKQGTLIHDSKCDCNICRAEDVIDAILAHEAPGEGK